MGETTIESTKHFTNAVSSGYDYIVVGGGTAGCVLAARLSENESVRVLLLEAGARDPLDAMAFPSLWPALLGSSADWGGTSVVQSATGTAMPLPRGRGLGGSSSINGLVFMRGHQSSYHAWGDLGCNGWGFGDLLPYFRRSETAPGRNPALRGSGGPLTVAPVPEHNPVITACLDAAVEVGYQRADDISGGLETGFGWSDVNVVKDQRQSAADAYLRPVLGRSNLNVVTDALVRRLYVANGRCTGVEYVQAGDIISVTCDREVVLTAGAIGSAQLLLLSGIGPQNHLAKVGVDVVTDLPGVGANLHDHPFSTVVYSAREQIPVIVSNPIGEAVGLVCSDLDLLTPDVQLVFGSGPYRAPSLLGPDNGYCIGFSVINPRSRGSVRLTSADIGTPPLVDPNYLGDLRDMATMVRGLAIAREIGDADALAVWRDKEALPGPDITDDAGAREYLRHSLLPYFHYAGSCSMGEENNEMTVVDIDLRVRGIEGLRVADASVMPAPISANTNATVLAIAERAAALINR